MIHLRQHCASFTAVKLCCHAVINVVPKLHDKQKTLSKCSFIANGLDVHVVQGRTYYQNQCDIFFFFFSFLLVLRVNQGHSFFFSLNLHAQGFSHA